MNFKSSSELKTLARGQMFGNYKTAIFSLIMMEAISNLTLNFARFFSNTQALSGLLMYYAIYFIIAVITGVFLVGQRYLYLSIARTGTCKLSDTWYGFRGQSDKPILIQLVIIIISFLSVIPFYVSIKLYDNTKNVTFIVFIAFSVLVALTVSILVSLFTSQIFYLLIDHPDKSVKELFQLSMTLMRGHKLRLFYIYVSFIGMFALVIVTFGIAILWVYPYMQMVYANFYLDLVKEPVVYYVVSDD